MSISFSTMPGQTLPPVTMTDSTVYTYSTEGWPIPSTITVNVEYGDTVTVYLSCDNGNSYPSKLTYAFTSSDSIVLTSGVTTVKFARTGGSGTTSSVGAC